MRVLVLDGNENQALAAVRSLARAGHEPWAGAETAWSKAGWSRACAGHFRYPEPGLNADRFVEVVAAETARQPGTLVLPMTERTTLPISAERDRILGAGGRLVLPPHETVLRAFDKQETTRLARSLGIATPDTWIVSTESEEEARAAARAVRYPVVLKPRSSQEFGGNVMRATGAPSYAGGAAQFMAAWQSMSSRCSSVLVQSFVDGVGIGYFALTRNGAMRAEFAHRRVRDVRPTGSGSSLRVSVAVDPIVRRHSLALLRALEWTGVAMVEYRMRADGTPVFIEVNGRFWNSLALAIHAGIDFPRLLAQMAVEGDVVPPRSHRPGVSCRWTLGDLRHLIEVWRGAPAGYPGRFPHRLTTLARVLRPVPGAYHDNFNWRDPLPEIGDWLHFGRRLVRRLKPSTAGPRHLRTGDAC